MLLFWVMTMRRRSPEHQLPLHTPLCSQVNIVYGYCEQGDLQAVIKKQKVGLLTATLGIYRYPALIYYKSDYEDPLL